MQTSSCTDKGGHLWKARSVWGAEYRDAAGVIRIANDRFGFTSAAPDATTVDYSVRGYDCTGKQIYVRAEENRVFDFKVGTAYLTLNPRNPPSSPGKAKIILSVGDGNDGFGNCTMTFVQPGTPPPTPTPTPTPTESTPTPSPTPTPRPHQRLPQRRRAACAPTRTSPRAAPTAGSPTVATTCTTTCGMPQYPGTKGTTEVCSYHSWNHIGTASNTGDGAVKTYPNVHKDYSGHTISSFSTLTSTFAATSRRRHLQRRLRPVAQRCAQ